MMRHTIRVVQVGQLQLHQPHAPLMIDSTHTQQRHNLASTIQPLSIEVDSLRQENVKYHHQQSMWQQRMHERNQRMERVTQTNVAGCWRLFSTESEATHIRSGA
jgi:FtsZ-binding cell division protein ZapB